jgi:hypothetical protein
MGEVRRRSVIKGLDWGRIITTHSLRVERRRVRERRNMKLELKGHSLPGAGMNGKVIRASWDENVREN